MFTLIDKNFMITFKLNNVVISNSFQSQKSQ